MNFHNERMQPPQIEQLTLDRWCINITKLLSESGIEANVDVKSWRDEMIKQIVYDIRAYLTSKKSEVVKSKKITVTLAKSFDVPDGWWQHLKHDWMPRWLLGWVPDVRYKTITLEHSEEVEVERIEQTIKVCPHIKLDPMHRHFNFLKQSPMEDEITEAEEIWKLRRFVRSLLSPIGSYDYDNLSHECSPRVAEEAKKVLGL